MTTNDDVVTFFMLQISQQWKYYLRNLHRDAKCDFKQKKKDFFLLSSECDEMENTKLRCKQKNGSITCEHFIRSSHNFSSSRLFVHLRINELQFTICAGKKADHFVHTLCVSNANFNNVDFACRCFCLSSTSMCIWLGIPDKPRAEISISTNDLHRLRRHRRWRCYFTLFLPFSLFSDVWQNDIRAHDAYRSANRELYGQKKV